MDALDISQRTFLDSISYLGIKQLRRESFGFGKRDLYEASIFFGADAVSNIILKELPGDFRPLEVPGVEVPKAIAISLVMSAFKWLMRSGLSIKRVLMDFIEILIALGLGKWIETGLMKIEKGEVSAQ